MRGGDPRNSGCGTQRGELVMVGRVELASRFPPPPSAWLRGGAYLWIILTFPLSAEEAVKVLMVRRAERGEPLSAFRFPL